MPQKLTPAAYVIAEFGGPRNLCRALEAVLGKTVYDSTVSRWAHNPKRDDPDSGYIPPEWHRAILLAAEREGKDVRSEHLIFGGERTIEDA